MFIFTAYAMRTPGHFRFLAGLPDGVYNPYKKVQTGF